MVGGGRMDGGDQVGGGDHLGGGDPLHGGDPIGSGDPMGGADPIGGGDPMIGGGRMQGGDPVGGGDRIRGGDPMAGGDRLGGRDPGGGGDPMGGEAPSPVVSPLPAAADGPGGAGGVLPDAAGCAVLRLAVLVARPAPRALRREEAEPAMILPGGPFWHASLSPARCVRRLRADISLCQGRQGGPPPRVWLKSQIVVASFSLLRGFLVRWRQAQNSWNSQSSENSKNSGSGPPDPYFLESLFSEFQEFQWGGVSGPAFLEIRDSVEFCNLPRIPRTARVP